MLLDCDIGKNIEKPVLSFYPIEDGGHCRAHRYTGYIDGIQKSRGRGFILFAGNINIEFMFANVMDKRLRDIFEVGLAEVGGVEIEFSIGYVPKEGGVAVAA